jgi:hypothetical protein
MKFFYKNKYIMQNFKIKILHLIIGKKIIIKLKNIFNFYSILNYKNKIKRLK